MEWNFTQATQEIELLNKFNYFAVTLHSALYHGGYGIQTEYATPSAETQIIMQNQGEFNKSSMC